MVSHDEQMYSYFIDDILLSYSRSLLGTRYKWGGSNALSGFDCSGLIVEIFQAVGLLEHGSDFTAQGLYNHFTSDGRGCIALTPGLGCLSFYGVTTKRITHVGLHRDPYHMIEAGGGNSRTTDLSTADERDAVVRIRPVKYRRDYLCSVRPTVTLSATLDS